MEFRKDGFSCAKAREMDMVNYLSALGHEPRHIKGDDYWYLSPLRNEQTASFKINRKINLWYDHGDGRGGNLIDFAILYHNCSVGEFLTLLNSEQPFVRLNFSPALQPQKAEPKIEVISEKALASADLLLYLRERRIPVATADLHCKEITYRLGQKNYVAIGFRNDIGGYEIRNRYFKGSSSPKGFTQIKNGSNALAVFEGFIDFLSYLTVVSLTDIPLQDYLILNSLSFAEKAVPTILQYAAVHLFLDNDRAGQNCSLYLCSQDQRITDESGLYKNYKDFNDFLLRKPFPRPEDPGQNS